MEFIKKYYKYILPILLILIISSILFTFFYKCNDLKKLNIISDKLNKINSSLYVSDFNPKEASIKLNSSFNQIVDLKSELISLEMSNEKYKNLKETLLDHINLNLNLYLNSMSALSDTNKDNFTSTYQSLLKSRKEILDSADNLNKNDININYLGNSATFFDSLNDYVDTSYRNINDTEIMKSAKSDFLFSLDNIISDFSSLKEDLRDAVSDIRSKKRDISPLVCDIKNKQSSLKSLENEVSSISVPEDAFSCYEHMEDMINSYKIYLNKLSYAVKNDSSSDYDDAFDKYDDFLNYYDSFIKSLDEYRQG
ncbi:hypothetical protein [Clostridium sp. BJN0001]|uniref:hypothetical protein n=1 Tax=Clostridium sp. BJN0001 TaxID=2930219 RepID=UPI001FD054A1|nr:hypothetical protein [Clostridium sp. BJN0001]